MPSYDPQWFHEYICSKIQDWHTGKGKSRLMLFMPPQHGKSQISSRHAPAWILGDDPSMKIAIAAYNGTIASGFSRNAQEIITDPIYKEIFPDTRIPEVGQISNKEVRNSTQVEVVGKKGSIVSVGVGGGLTSRQVDRMIIDDVYKDHTEAWSPIQRKNVADWFDAVVETRLHNESKVLIVFTRWHEEDLAGYLLEEQKELWDVVSLPAIKEEEFTVEEDPRKPDQALWETRHSIERILSIKKRNETIFENLYQQNPKPQKGLLYGNRFKLYEINALKSLLKDSKIFTYIDVADSGSDYLCAVTVIKKGSYLYVIDVVYSIDGAEVTVPLVVDSIMKHGSTMVHIESNAGGSIYGKNVESLFKKRKAKEGGKHCVFKRFHQSANKEARIIHNAPSVLEFIAVPEDWHMKWPLFRKHLVKFEKELKKNTNDDAADTMTGLIEKSESKHGSYAYSTD